MAGHGSVDLTIEFGATTVAKQHYFGQPIRNGLLHLADDVGQRLVMRSDVSSESTSTRRISRRPVCRDGRTPDPIIVGKDAVERPVTPPPEINVSAELKSLLQLQDDDDAVDALQSRMDAVTARTNAMKKSYAIVVLGRQPNGIHDPAQDAGFDGLAAIEL